ncbi:MAG: ABC transporter permease subunit [Nitrospinae bacterium]|nr:ABC transporter permease subunit [Nitrospinota bacterium]
MGGMTAVMKRELQSYFYSPVAYAVMVMFLIIAGYFFYTGMVYYGVASFEISRMAQFGGGMEQELNVEEYILRPLFGNMSVVLLMMAPLFTMRLFSEEKKGGSIELLFTWPIKDLALVMGKYLAALAMVSIMVAPTFIYIGLLAYHSGFSWGCVVTGYLGLILLGGAFISLGIFISTLTENQIISAAITFGALLLFWIISWAAGSDTGTIAEILKGFSILERVDNFAKGVLDTRDIVYYATFNFFFLFLTIRSLESKNWRG